VHALLDWARTQAGTVLWINADIALCSSWAELERIRLLTGDGLCSFVRHNHAGDERSASPDRYGLDAFLFRGGSVPPVPESTLRIGLPFWDYLLPHGFAAAGRPLFGVDFPALFHLQHEIRWSWDVWHDCGREFARVTGEPVDEESLAAYHAMSARVRARIAARSHSIGQSPTPIREWVEERFSSPGLKLFLELGSHRGTDTAWLAQLPDVVLHAFEPDPRNDQPPRSNVTVHRAAIADVDGHGPLIPSREGWGDEWTFSSSIKQPTRHLTRYPVTFGTPIDVPFLTLDTFYRRQELDVIDFIWADIQGAEADMIRGGGEALARTRYLYTEYSNDELYEGQATLEGILAMLPAFRVLEVWPEDVLLENTGLTTR
jgi:FkbM family methyltransferase